MALNNSQYAQIMREYDRRQIAARHEYEEHREFLREECPAVLELEQEYVNASIAASRAVLRKDEAEADRMKLRMEDCLEQKTILLKGFGLPEDFMEMHYFCPLCRDTGYVGQRKCSCFHKLEAELYKEESNLDTILSQENFEHYSERYYDNVFPMPPYGETTAEHMRGICAECRSFAQSFREIKYNLLLTGPAGTGKTFFTHCIAAELLKQGVSVYYLTADELTGIFERNRFGKKNEEQNTEDYQKVFRCELLIIDDLGTEWNNSVMNVDLFSCLNERLIHKRPTVISTNLNIVEISDRYSERVASRIIGNYRILELVGEDIRKKF